MANSYLSGEFTEEVWEYYCIIGDKEITLLSKDFKTVIRVLQLDVEVISVLHDLKFHCLLIIDENLNVLTYNLRSRQLGTRKRTVQDLYRILKLDFFVD